MGGQTPDGLVEEAHRLETAAIEIGEEDARGRELRAQAAKLRLAAIGAKPYPVVVCTSCFVITGWAAADGRCHACLRSAQLRAAFADPHGGWVSLADTRQKAAKPSPPPFGARLAALAGRRAGLERALAEAWLKRVDPDETGPIAPENGFELEVAKRDEVEAADGSGILVRFSTAAHRFVDGSWTQLESTKIVAADLLVPAAFAADLPIEQLAEAWTDYGSAVERFNRAAWARQSQARETERLAREEHAEALRQQRHVSELLDEGG